MLSGMLVASQPSDVSQVRVRHPGTKFVNHNLLRAANVEEIVGDALAIWNEHAT